jgi:branched-subunit amino acid ABC-type transport system permease component
VGNWAWIPAVLVGAFLAYVVAVSVADNPDQTGYVIGYVSVAFLVALAVRWLYVRLRPAVRRPPFWSPWIVVIAGFLFLIARLGSQAG